MVDTEPANAAGRDRFAIRDHRDQIAPPDATWAPATVTAAAAARQLSGAGWRRLHRAERRRAGLLRSATVAQMVTDLSAVHADTNPMPGEFAVLRLHREVLVVSWEHDDGQRTRLVEIDRVYPDAAGYYGVGAHLWPWLPAR